MNIVPLVLLFIGLFAMLQSMVLCTQSATAERTATAPNGTSLPNDDTSPGKVYQIVQASAKTTNSSELAKKQLQELEKEKGNANKSVLLAAENAARPRKVTDTNTNSSNTNSTTKSTPATLPQAAKTIPLTKSTQNTTAVSAGAAADKNNKPKELAADTKNASTSAKTSTSTTTTTTTTTTTAKPTTTPRPKKPKIVFSMDMHPEWENDKVSKPAQAKQNQAAGSLTTVVAAPTVSSAVLPEQEPPVVQPSQELSSSDLSNRGRNEYTVPIVSALLVVPLAVAVIISIYRRLRDFWSTRHYRRMDFLVDGMYND